MIEAICVALILTLALGAWAWKRRAYWKGYEEGEVDSAIGRQVRAAFASPCFCGAPSDKAVGVCRRQCAISNRCTVSGQWLMTHTGGKTNGAHLH